jgi:small-conductance mechanosensitive channel
MRLLLSEVTSTPTPTECVTPPVSSTVAGFVELLRNAFNLDQFTSEAIVSVTIFFTALLIAWVGNQIFEKYFSKLTQKTSSNLDDKILHNVRTPIFLVAILIGSYYSLDTLSILAPHRDLIYKIFIVAQILAVAFMLVRIASILIAWYGERRAKQDMAVSNHLLFVFNKIIQFIILVGAVLAILWAFNQNLSSVVVGLGVGGIAIALAVQSTLSDVLSAFSIYFDRPFEIGDFVVIGDNAGTVTKIGIKSTRIQLLQGEELVIPNQVLTSSNLRNFKKLTKRRIVFSIGVPFDTPFEKLKKIPDLIADVIKNIQLAQFDRAHFQSYGDFSLRFEVVYYVTVSDYAKYMDVQQEINLGIKKAFEKEGIQIAIPTQSIFLNKKID